MRVRVREKVGVKGHQVAFHTNIIDDVVRKLSPGRQGDRLVHACMHACVRMCVCVCMWTCQHAGSQVPPSPLLPAPPPHTKEAYQFMTKNATTSGRRTGDTTQKAMPMM